MKENQKYEQISEQEETGGEYEVDLMELLYRLLEKWKLIVAAALIGAVVMAFYSFLIAKPVYEATSKLYVLNASDSAINLSDLQIGSYLTSDYVQVFEAWEVHEMVMQNLNLDYEYEEMREMLTISNPGNTRILHIAIQAEDPVFAATLANEYADVAKKYISETMMTDEPSTLSEALVPTKPVGPKKGVNTLLGFVLGMMVMVGVIVVQFLMDDKIKTTEDIRKYTGMPTLAVIPNNESSHRQSSKRRR